jgi:hypothetical protein
MVESGSRWVYYCNYRRCLLGHGVLNEGGRLSVAKECTVQYQLLNLSHLGRELVWVRLVDKGRTTRSKGLIRLSIVRGKE